MALANEPAGVKRARLTHRTSTTPRSRTYALRLWPRTPPPPARIRQLGPPLLVRDIFRDHARAAMMRRLNMARATRPAQAELIARRIGALERLFAKPIAAVRSLARKLNTAPNLALKLAVRGWPRSPHADGDAQIESDHAAYAGARHFKPDSS